MRVRLLGFYFRLLNLSILIFLSFSVCSQQIQILDDTEQPLEAVWVFNNRDGSSNFTDQRGLVVLEKIQADDVLTFEHLGFKTIKLDMQALADIEYTVRMQSVSEILDAITVVGRTDNRTQEVFNETALISRRSMLLSNAQTTADAMSKNGELYIQKSQMGGGSPVMRGFEANRLLLVVDGVRMNNAIYRNGHLHNAITIDAMSLSNIELIFGPGSLSYGSDALGGVIHFRTRMPKFNFDVNRKHAREVSYKLRYASANQEKTAHLSMNNAWNNLAILTGVTVSKFEDLRAGSRRPASYPGFGARKNYVVRIDEEDQVLSNENPDIQKGTSYSQLDVFQKMAINLSDALKVSTNLQFSTSTNVPRYDLLTEGDGDTFKYAQWYYGPQNRFLGSLRLDYKEDHRLIDQIIAIASSQRIDEDRHNRKFNSAILESTREDIWVHSFTLDLIKKFRNDHTINYGIDFQDNHLRSEGMGEDILTGIKQLNVLSRYPDEKARLFNAGAYVNYTLEKKLFHFQSGIRLTNNQIHISYSENGPIAWPSNFYEGIRNNNTALAYSAGLKFIPSKFTELKLNLSSAFRNPNIDDLAKIRVKNGEILIPNPELQTEQVYNAELGIKQHLIIADRDHHLQMNGFYSQLTNGIVRDDFTLPDGSDKYFDGLDSLSVVANVNAEEVLIFGAFIGLNGRISEEFSYGTRINYTKGRIIEGEQSRPAGHIPPLFGSFSLNWEKTKWQIKLSMLFNASKPIESYGGSVDNPEYATAEGSYEWMIFSIHSSYKINNEMSINVGLENILDKHYRPFASGVSAPGFNAIISVQGKF